MKYVLSLCGGVCEKPIPMSKFLDYVPVVDRFDIMYAWLEGKPASIPGESGYYFLIDLPI